MVQAGAQTAPGSRSGAASTALRGKGDDGELPPNNWVSAFGGSAVVADPGHVGWWYLHLFDPRSPTSTGTTPRCTPTTPRRCTSGSASRRRFRIDVAHSLVKAPATRRPSPTTCGTGQRVRTGLGPARRARRVARVATAGDSYDPLARSSAKPGCARRGAGCLHRPTSCTPRSTSTSSSLLGRRGHPRRDRHVAAHVVRGRRTAHVGAVEPRRVAPVTRFAPWLNSTTIDLEAGAAALSRCRCSAGAAGIGVPLPGRGARPPRGVDLPDDVRQDPNFFPPNARSRP